MAITSKMSILTPSYNQGCFIEKNIQSVRNQDYSNVEHIVIDGGSTDNTVEVLRRYPHLKWISEKDGGQADALNKGLRLATGELVGWINSDDYYEDRVFPVIADAFRDTSVQWVIADLTRLYEASGDKVRGHSPKVTFDALVENPDIVRQQATFFRKSLLAAVGGWDATLYMIMDYDLWLRMAKLAQPKYLDINVAYYRIHEGQKTSTRNIVRQYREIDAVLRRNGVPLRQRATVGLRKRYYFAKTILKNALIDLKIAEAKYVNRSFREDAQE